MKSTRITNEYKLAGHIEIPRYQVGQRNSIKTSDNVKILVRLGTGRAPKLDSQNYQSFVLPDGGRALIGEQVIKLEPGKATLKVIKTKVGRATCHYITVWGQSLISTLDSYLLFVTARAESEKASASLCTQMNSILAGLGLG